MEEKEKKEKKKEHLVLVSVVYTESTIHQRAHIAIHSHTPTSPCIPYHHTDRKHPQYSVLVA